MTFRLATLDDLEEIKSTYREIICKMNQDNISIWDDVYPCEFFYDDIEKNGLYVLEENNKIISAFALCDSNTGDKSVKWPSEHTNVLYIDRFAVNVNYLNRGIGSIMLQNACMTAKEKGAQALRLFVVDINKPAISLYRKNNFLQADGVFDEKIDDELTLHEFGFEIKI